MDQEAPLFSIVTPVYNTPLDILRTTIDSVRTQTFDDWELILIDDASPDDRVREVLREAAAADRRVRVIEREQNGHIVAASNDGVDAARGEFIALLDHDDLLVPRALEFVAKVVTHEPEVDYVYSDEDKVDDTGQFYEEFRKPAWSPERLRGHMYTCHFSVLRASLVREVGGFHAGFEGSQDHDLVLRVTERARKVVHIPRVLYHWRAIPGSAAGDPHAKPYAWQAGRAAVEAHVARVGIDADVDFGPGLGTYHLERRLLDPSVRVSVVIPTRGAEGLVWGERRVFVVEAVRSLLKLGGHENVEVVVVHDPVTPADVLEQLKAAAPAQLQLLPYRRPFNFSQACNLGVVSSHGDVVLLLNDDVEISSSGFLVQLVAPLFEDGVGMTGPQAFLSNTRVQQAGLVIDDRLRSLFADDTKTRHAGPFLVREAMGAQVGNALMVNREVSGLSASCLAIRREVYDEVGGMSEIFPLNFGDADLSLKVGRTGRRLLFIAHATMYHFEAQSREPSVRREEMRAFVKRWQPPPYDRHMPDAPESFPGVEERVHTRPRVRWQ